jgi:flagellar assembly protein FliH
VPVGKIVRGAKLVRQRYVLVVPEIARRSAARIVEDLDQRFGVAGEAEDREPVGFEGDAACEAAREPEIAWERVRADAKALIDAALAEGEAMLSRSAQEARALVERAQEQAAEIEARSRARGLEQGLEEGRAAARAETSDAVDAIVELVESVREERHRVVESAEPEVVRLAMAIAERVVHEQIAIDPNVVVESVRHALMRLAGGEVVTLRVNPADLETIREHRDALASGSDVQHLRVVEDQRVDRGGVVVETEAGTIDAKISTQLREARRAIQSAETISVQAS